MISLQEITDFAKINKLDYGTDINIIIEAYKALLKAKGFEEPDNSSIDVPAEKAKLEIERDKLFKWYRSHLHPSITVGVDAAKIFYEHIDCFKEDNAIILTPNVTYIGTCEFTDTDGRLKGAKVFIDTSAQKDKREVFFNFYEKALSNILIEYPGIVLDREVMR